jgi:DNA-binding response OmpR family regulator
MDGRILLVQWDGPAAKKVAEELKKDGWVVDVESKDVAKVGTTQRPDAIVIDFSKKAPQSVQAAEAISANRAIRNIPVVLVGVPDEERTKTRRAAPSALYSSPGGLRAVLQTMW